MKKTTLKAGKIALSLGLMLTLSIPQVYATEDVTNAVSTIHKDVASNVASYLQWNTEFDLTVNGKKIGTKGEMVNTRMLIPLRAVFEAAGAVVKWHSDMQSWSAKGEGFTATQKLGESKVNVNGVVYELDHEAVLDHGNMMVSSRIIEAALGLELRWDSANRMLLASKVTSTSGFKAWSDAFTAYNNIPDKYSHGYGQNISLPVSWKDAPEGTKSIAVVMYDIHPIADNFIHWSVLNIPVSDGGIAEGASGKFSDGAVELNEYYGAEPPRYSGDHLYRLAVYALDTDKLDLPATAPVFFEQLEPLLMAHSLGYSKQDGFVHQN
ncbi:YbhB/YbcL family Raf kinase inhibitor-like protein [Paenibacillus sp. PR3]|uniref:YbhB/YbcL family Raf kinase inhibitor-like protein n=1 Tax=Paenibacillus terricola TaxID=2763503 RepID=A0ABR8MT69_9BACL|nr:YbhB/YbcL family Raf kinase inhibitor-like protein [Paenibacillus terricola]MBD3918060.1 YbhB/YbcL family Raf kinase inhibitor-like protein [Paenibacillus terricola]